MTTTSGAPRAPKRTPLSRERILDTASALISEDGAPGFSMRRLADRLGVTPMALYKWYDNRDHLLDALTSRTIEEPLPSPLVLTGTWEQRVVQVAVAIRGRLLEHLALLRMDGASRRLATTILGFADTGLQLMVELGYEDQAAVDAYRVVFWSTIDYCLVIDATDAMPATQGADWFAAQLEAVAADQAAESLPTLTAFLPKFSAVDRDAFFVTTIETVAAGLRARAPQG